jgi:hypothetical protein
MLFVVFVEGLSVEGDVNAMVEIVEKKKTYILQYPRVLLRNAWPQENAERKK